MADKPDKPEGHDNPKHNQIFTVVHPDTGETRDVTQHQWHVEKLGRAGFKKPDGLPDEPDVPPVEPEEEGG